MKTTWRRQITRNDLLRDSEKQHNYKYDCKEYVTLIMLHDPM